MKLELICVSDKGVYYENNTRNCRGSGILLELEPASKIIKIKIKFFLIEFKFRLVRTQPTPDK